VSHLRIRRAQKGDEERIQAVIKAVWDEHGFAWDPAYYNRDLTDIQRHYFDAGGDFWVLVDGGAVVGTAGYLPRSDGVCELMRLYLLKSARGQGWGKRLFQHVVDAARQRGFKQMVIWSDKQLETAHQMYLRFGAKPIGDRWVRDADTYEEWGFVLDL
jgi:putative acetyltransferase